VGSSYEQVGFEVLTALDMKSSIFREIQRTERSYIPEDRTLHMNMFVNFRLPYKEENLLTSSTIVSFQRRTLFREGGQKSKLRMLRAGNHVNPRYPVCEPTSQLRGRSTNHSSEEYSINQWFSNIFDSRRTVKYITISWRTSCEKLKVY
jgi:hypothetical protein